MSDLLTKARLDVASKREVSVILSLQTFRNRLAEVIDQAQHFAALGPAGGGGQSADSALVFREGLEVTERERESQITVIPTACFSYLDVKSILARAGNRKEDQTVVRVYG
jgi:hypothetical protein